MYLNVQAQFCWQNTSKTYSKNVWQQKNYSLKTLFPLLEIRIFWFFFCLSQLFRCQVIKDNKSLHTLFSLKGMGKSSFSMLNSDQTHILGQRISWSNHLIYYHSKKGESWDIVNEQRFVLLLHTVCHCHGKDIPNHHCHIMKLRTCVQN